MPTNTSERELERLVCRALSGNDCEPPAAATVGEPPAGYGGVGWAGGNKHDYDRGYCLDTAQLAAFLRATQPDTAAALLNHGEMVRRRFFHRLGSEISSRGTADVLRNGIKHENHSINLFYGAASAENHEAQALFEQNRFTVVRQLNYSPNTQQALDVALFINGLPVLTFELKNSLTKQTAADAVEQYKKDRNPQEKLFSRGRCVAHFALDENGAYFCPHLLGRKSRFFPFNKGHNDGGGNPPNPSGLRVEYLWREVLTRRSLTDILEHYAQKMADRQIFPRYHQLEAVRRLLADVGDNGVGRRYLIQHSAGSGKSHSIAWLACQLVNLHREGRPVFGSIVVVTDRKLLDSQIHETIRSQVQLPHLIGHAGSAADLRRLLADGKKIIISTVQKFPHIMGAVGGAESTRTFAIIIDEAHSGQGGRASTAMIRALRRTGGVVADDATEEDVINALMESRKLLDNASYFAFTATPKRKTLEIFGCPQPPQADGTTPYRAFHLYAMKQAIEEGFILDVLAHYSPVESYYKIIKTVADDPKFDREKAHKRLRRYVEGHADAIRQKAETMVEHFHQQVLAHGKVGGEARAMVVAGSVARAIEYFHVIRDYLNEIKSPHKPIVAFSDERDYGGRRVSEASLNGFPSADIAAKIRQTPYRFLVCADKFQTGYDEPLLHTMYVDKVLHGIRAVQTLSRLNRAHPQKNDTFVLDFANDSDDICRAFAPYYCATTLADATDPNKLHDMQDKLDRAGVYLRTAVDELVRLYLNNQPRERLDPILDDCVEAYLGRLDENGQISFKGMAQNFCRSYEFLAALLPYNRAEWEKLSIFLRLLIPKLPSPQESDLSAGILEAIDMDSYRLEMQERMRIILPDEERKLPPYDPPRSPDGEREPETEHLSRIVREFNRIFGDVEWSSEDCRLMTEELPADVARDLAYQYAVRNSGAQNARIQSDDTVSRVINDNYFDKDEFFKRFSDDRIFRKKLFEFIFNVTYKSRSTDDGAF